MATPKHRFVLHIKGKPFKEEWIDEVEYLLSAFEHDYEEFEPVVKEVSVRDGNELNVFVYIQIQWAKRGLSSAIARKYKEFLLGVLYNELDYFGDSEWEYKSWQWR